MRAIILAAGIGSRISPITNLITKCLIEINGKKIIKRQIDSLLKVNINEIIVVVGYLKNKIKSILKDSVVYIENPIYHNSNSSYSLWLARDFIDEGFIYLNSDLIFEEGIIKKLLDSKFENAMMIDKNINTKGDMFKVKMDGNKIIKLDKKLNPNECSAEAPGPVKFSKKGARKIFKKLDEYISNEDKSQWCYTIFSEVAEEINLRGIHVEGLVWMEIDNVEDLKKARKMNF